MAIIEQKLQSNVHPREVSITSHVPAHGGIAVQNASVAIGKTNLISL